MNARVEKPDRPYRGQPGEDERPAGGPGGEIINMAKDIGTGIEGPGPCHLPNRQRDDRSYHDDEIDVYTSRLDFRHDGSGKYRT